MKRHRTLFVLAAVYAVASLIHFAHNAEFIADYPNMPASWTRSGVYLVWAAITVLGAAGLLLLARGYRFAGLLVLAVYAAFGLDSLGHYVLAPLSAHSPGMNSTILLEVAAAALVLVEVARQLGRR